MVNALEAHQILQLCYEAVRDSEELKNFCLERYEKRHKTYLDFDPMNLPEREDLPMVVIYDLEGDERGEGLNKASCSVYFGVALENETINDDLDGEVVIGRNMPGKTEVEQFRALVEKVIGAIKDFDRVYTTGQTLKDDFYPLFRTDSKIKIELYQSSRNHNVRG